jgi:hypothetical protein
VELVMRIPGGLFWGGLAGGLVLGGALVVAGIVLLALKRKAGFALLGAGVLSALFGLLLLVCLFLDVWCTGRSGAWIC